LFPAAPGRVPGIREPEDPRSAAGDRPRGAPTHPRVLREGRALWPGDGLGQAGGAMAPIVTRVAVLAIVSLMLFVPRIHADPIKVHLAEGNTRGFLVLRPPGGEPIAHGELRQRLSGGVIESRLLLSFKDGSLYDERVTFSQNEVFRLEAYRLIQ